MAFSANLDEFAPGGRRFVATMPEDLTSGKGCTCKPGKCSQMRTCGCRKLAAYCYGKCSCGPECGNMVRNILILTGLYHGNAGEHSVGLFTRGSPPNARPRVGYDYVYPHEIRHSQRVGLYVKGLGYKEGQMVGPYTGEWMTETDIMIKSG